MGVTTLVRPESLSAVFERTKSIEAFSSYANTNKMRNKFRGGLTTLIPVFAEIFSTKLGAIPSRRLNNTSARQIGKVMCQL